MTTYVKSSEAARILGVAPATLYAYVSRGRVARLRAADGRTSLFAVDDLEALRSNNRRVDTAPLPTIDVQIASAITVLGDDGVEFRGHSLATLARTRTFEDVAELLWTGTLAATTAEWPRTDPDDDRAVTAVLDQLDVTPMARLSVVATVLGGRHPADDALTAARRLLLSAPGAVGSARRSGPYALRLAGAWSRRPSDGLVRALDTALVLLADHELATSTLAVRVAASVRASPYAAICSGLGTLDGALHGSAGMHVHHLLDECRDRDPAVVVDEYRRNGRLVPGFGHKIYRRADPRFLPLLDAVRSIAPGDARLALIDTVLAEVVRTLPTRPNVDFALGALTWLARLPPDAPIFAIARIAGWAAHYDEELGEVPVRFRGLARRPA